ncbi:hypothetical protein Tco_0570561 [Tanacetum coccineum]
MIEKPDYRKSHGAKTPSEVQRMQRVPYASAIGSIIEIHWTAVKAILKYLRNTKDMILVRGLEECQQSTTAMSSTEVEYIAAAEASMEVVWMRKFIDGLGGVVPSNKRPMEMLCDNEHAIAIANDPRILKGARHFQRKYHYIREHYEHAMTIGIVPASSLICSGNTTRIMRRTLMIILVFTLCEEQVKWNSVLMKLSDDLLALDKIVLFGFSDQKLERTATFSISTNSEVVHCITGSMAAFFNVSNHHCDSDSRCIDPVSA